MDEDPVELSRKLRAQHEELRNLLSELEVMLSGHPMGVAAAADLAREARGAYERELLFDPYGRVRDAGQLRKLVSLDEKRRELSRTISRTADQTHELYELDGECKSLSEELGVGALIGHPQFQDMLRIAEAVEMGDSGDPRGQPKDWPEGSPWLREPKQWDPDMYLANVAERHLRDVGVMLTASTDAKLRLGWSVRLAAARERALTEEVLRAGGIEEADTAGVTKEYLDWLQPKNTSPVRFRLAETGGWSNEFDDAATRSELHAKAERGHGGGAEVGDLADSLTAIEFANLDAHLLEVAHELVVCLDSEARTGGEAPVVKEDGGLLPPHQDAPLTARENAILRLLKGLEPDAAGLPGALNSPQVCEGLSKLRPQIAIGDDEARRVLSILKKRGLVENKRGVGYWAVDPPLGD